MNCKVNKLNSNRLLLFSLSLSLADASSCVSCRTATFFVTSMPFLTHYQFFSCLTSTFKYKRKFGTFGLCGFSVYWFFFVKNLMLMIIVLDYYHFFILLIYARFYPYQHIFFSVEIIKTLLARSKEMKK